MPLRNTASAILAASAWFLAAGAPAETMVDTGGDGAWNATYGPVPVNSTGIVAAARFAATAKSVQVKEILTAGQAATAHVHYAICMRVADKSNTYLVDTRISKKAGGTYSIDAWKKVKACK